MHSASALYECIDAGVANGDLAIVKLFVLENGIAEYFGREEVTVTMDDYARFDAAIATATQKGHQEIVDLLTQARDFVRAAVTNDAVALETVIAARPEITKTKLGDSVLRIVCGEGLVEAARVLLANGANPQA